MLKAFRRPLKRCDQIKDRLPVLAGDHAAIGKAAPVKIALHAVINRLFVSAGAQEISVKGMCLAVWLDRAPGGAKRLGNRLPAKDAARPFGMATAGK